MTVTTMLPKRNPDSLLPFCLFVCLFIRFVRCFDVLSSLKTVRKTRNPRVKGRGSWSFSPGEILEKDRRGSHMKTQTPKFLWRSSHYERQVVWRTIVNKRPQKSNYNVRITGHKSQWKSLSPSLSSQWNGIYIDFKDKEIPM